MFIFPYGSTDLTRLFALEDRLEHAIVLAKAGDLGGEEVAADGNDGFLYMYGPDADHLFETILPVLKSADFMNGATVKRRYGPADRNPRESTVTVISGCGSDRAQSGA